MDVFSAGVVIWEVASGRRLVPVTLTNDEALTMLSQILSGDKSIVPMTTRGGMVRTGESVKSLQLSSVLANYEGAGPGGLYLAPCRKPAGKEDHRSTLQVTTCTSLPSDVFRNEAPLLNVFGDSGACKPLNRAR